MKYQSSNTKLVHDLIFTEDKKRYKCPECGNDSKRKNPTDLQYYQKEDRAHCFKCGTTFFEYKPYKKEKEYVLPERVNNTKLSDEHLRYWNSRMISQETLKKLNVYSHGNWICFPFLRDGQWINIKARTIDKRFRLKSGAELIWYNFDALTSNDKIIICEGEGEVLTWVENGYNNVISVPNGAGNNVEYLDNTIKLFDHIDTVYLATDNDSKGVELRDELARRIGLEKCSLISFKECKDGNEYFCKHGGLEFKKLIDECRPVPLDGIIKVDQLESDILDLYENGIKPGSALNVEEIDKYCTWELGRLATVTGVPGSGKSEFVDFIVSRLNLLYGWKAAYFTPENYPLKFHYAKLHEKYSGRKFKKQYEDNTFWGVYEHIKDNYYYILNEEDMTVKTVLDNAKMLVKQYGVKVVVIDPYNKLDHQYSSKTSETQYISKFLDEITSFSKFYNVLVFLVAHPRKMASGEVPSLYDIAGSANFYNKTDYGFTVHRQRGDDGAMVNSVDIHWQKIKFKHLGEQGVSELKYNYNNGRFEVGSVDNWDNSNWLYSAQNNNIDFTETNRNDDITQTIDQIPF